MSLQKGASSTPPHYLILGAGRAASHFAHYFELLGLSYSSWNRRLEPGPGKLLQAKLASASHVLVLVTDSAIEPLLTQAKELTKTFTETAEQVWIHCSGSLTTSLATGCHPLMTFSPSRKYNLETYRSMAFVIDQGARPFPQLLPGLPNPSYQIDPKKKALYHALCVLSGNFTTLLWQKLFEGLESKMLIPSQAAMPYLRAVCENIAQNPETALTGPLARGDQETIRRNLESLAQDPFSDVYEAFVRTQKKEMPS